MAISIDTGACVLADYSQIEVNGSVEQFTLLVLTYSARLSLLHRFTEHYSRCNSVCECTCSGGCDSLDFK